MADNKIRVLVVDDSALVRQVLSTIINAQADMEVVAACMDPLFARERIKQLQPDVITLDIEMPRMDGLTFLDKLMRLHPLPVVMISTLTHAGAEATLRALELGAVDYLPKPAGFSGKQLLDDYAEKLVEKIRMAAQSRPKLRAVAQMPKVQPAPIGHADQAALIAVGASTGGTEAIREVLQGLPADMPPMLITQHIPEAFAGPFAERMDATSALSVKLAGDGMPIHSGSVYIAPGNQHLRVEGRNGRYVCRLSSPEADPVNRHRPSVEVLFDSLARCAGHHGLALMLTGMGRDGADAMLRVRQAGGATLVQDKASSVVWGMPGAAVEVGAAEVQLPLSQIPGRLAWWARRSKQAV